jgi:AcrR family transcriptional regulator
VLGAVAEAAEVSQETIYATFGSKRGLLEGVIEATIRGPGASVPLEEQPGWGEIEQLPTPRERLRAYVRFSCDVLARTSPIHKIIRGASDGEPFAVELRARLLRERLESNTKRIRQYVGEALRPGVPLEVAAERYCALSSPEMHHLMTVELGWSQQAYEEWLAALAEAELLGPD